MKFTVITPTYQRAHTLARVYNSLCAQTFTDFEWVIVDDGSTDDTAELVAGWQAESRFSILYKKQSNMGKHIAVNSGVALARGEFIAIADSDDEFTSNGLELLYEGWLSIPEVEREGFCGVTGLCVNQFNNVLGDSFPADIFDSTPAECFYRYQIRGDKAGFLRADVLRQYPFPELKGFSFYLEGIIWNAIGRRYVTRYINQAVRVVFFDSGNQLTARNPKQLSQNRIFYAKLINDDIDYLTVAPWTMFKLALQGVRFSYHQRDSLKMQFSRLSKFRAKFVWFTALPVGFALFLIDGR